MKTLLIGFDGMDYYLAKEYYKGNLNVKKLVARVPLSGPSWATIYTGKSAENHKVHDAWGRPSNQNNGFKDIEPYCFWKIVEKEGNSIYTDNLPITPNGVPYIQDKNKDIVFWTNKLKGWEQELKQKSFEDVFKQVQNNCWNLIIEYVERKEDLVFVQFSFFDRMMHLFSLSEKQARRLYEYSFEIIETLQVALDPENLLVVSDHGFHYSELSHLKRVDGCLMINSNAENLISEEKHALFKEFLYDLLFKKSLIQRKHYKPIRDFKELLKILLFTKKKKELAKILLSSKSFKEKKAKLVERRQQLIKAETKFKNKIVQGVEQKEIFKTVLKTFQIKCPLLEKEIKKSTNSPILENQKLVASRLKGLGYI